MNRNKAEEQNEDGITSEGLPSIPYYKLFKFSTLFDKFLIFTGVGFSLLAGAAYCLVALTFGKATGAVVAYVHASESNGTFLEVMDSAEEKLIRAMNWFAAANGGLGTIIFMASYISTVLLNYSALRQTLTIRKLYFSAILNQDISWYDQNQTGDFSSRITDDLKKIEEGIGEKFGIVLFYGSVGISSLIVALVQGWLLALICMVLIPISMICIGFISFISSKLARQENEAYGDAGTIAEEVLTSIKTVVAFGGQAKEVERYNHFLIAAKNNNIRRSLFNGLSTGVIWLFSFAGYSLAFWYGLKLVLEEKGYPKDEITYDAGNMVTVVCSVANAQWNLGIIGPYIEIIGIAQGAASKIFQVIANQPTINLSRGIGKQPKRMNGKITFEDVHFNYPSRTDVKVLRGFNLTIKSDETVALVGLSGCGKSTCIQLLQRFYDPDSGYIYIDNNKITALDLDWMRSHIGVVGQDPVLFEATISENIRYGYLDATQNEIEEAAKKANAHTFITTLPQGYSTMIGERGAQLSGGQKQRIAIARALVRKPSILLLDEATSALDTKSEAIVQADLNTASYGCTTVIVAHRLSTVRKADRIIVIADGQVREEGFHEALMQAKGAYYKLVLAQCSETEENTNHETQILDVADKNDFLTRDNSNDNFGDKVPLLVKDEDFDQDTTETKSSLWTIMKYNSPEWWIITIGCLTSIFIGASMPIYSIIFGKVIGIFANKGTADAQIEGNKYSLNFLILGVVTGIAMLIQIYIFGIAGERLTMRLRSFMFKAMLNQEMGWFDDKDNGVGALCARLSGEAAKVQGATGQRIGAILNAATTIVYAISVAFYYQWKLALVAFSFTPVVIVSLYLEQRVLANESKGNYESLQKSTKIAVEAINGIRTVTSLGCEQVFTDLYMTELHPYQSSAIRNTHFRGLVYGLFRSLMCFTYAATLYYGAMLVKDEHVSYGHVLIICECMVSTSWSLTNAIAFIPNFSDAVIAGNRIFQLSNRTPRIVDGSQNVNEIRDTENIRYNNVFFSYPNRPSVTVLKGLNLSVLKGKMVALVGSSGCGKSTIIQLLERFYDPTSGSVEIDERGIEKMSLLALRSHFSVVSQEPNLFKKSIADNISYGDNSRFVSIEEIISASKQANIHTFITSLPLGYETILGEKGAQLSGGEKQRIAIARALVRNPKVLLLDEATSALDAESEMAVQEALENAQIGRTCICIAHRLTTIQNADLICVIHHGRFAEMGTHAELLNRKGLYYNLYTLQNYK